MKLSKVLLQLVTLGWPSEFFSVKVTADNNRLMSLIFKNADTSTGKSNLQPLWATRMIFGNFFNNVTNLFSADLIRTD